MSSGVRSHLQRLDLQRGKGYMFMQRNLVRLVVIALAVIPLSGCSFFDELGAVRTFREANTAYQRGFYDDAIALYEEVLSVIDESGGQSDLAQQLTPAYFYIANSYDSLYLPGSQAAENVHNLDEAIRYYELAVDRIPDPSLQLLSMQWLVAAFGPDKANDPTRSEPVLKAMILDDPENPDNYFRIAQLYEEAGLFDDAEAIYRAVQTFRSEDPIVYLQLAGFYNRAGEFEQTIDALEEARADRTRQPGSVLHDLDLLLGKGVSGFPNYPGPEARVRNGGIGSQ